MTTEDLNPEIDLGRDLDLEEINGYPIKSVTLYTVEFWGANFLLRNRVDKGEFA